LEALHRGSVVGLSCQRARRIMGSVILNECELVKVVE